MKNHILIVEDEPTIATGLRDDMELEGFTVEVVDNGTVALRRILEGGFDLILLRCDAAGYGRLRRLP